MCMLFSQWLKVNLFLGNNYIECCWILEQKSISLILLTFKALDYNSPTRNKMRSYDS